MGTVPDPHLKEILSLDTVAVVGFSSTPGKDAHEVPKYLMDNGYEVIPINPTTDEILGEHAYDSLAEVEEDIDIVNVFRPSDEVPGIVDTALERDDVSVLWTQRNIVHDDAADRAEDAGMLVVQDHCIRGEHRRVYK